MTSYLHQLIYIKYEHTAASPAFPLSRPHRGLWVMCPQVRSVVLVLDVLRLKRLEDKQTPQKKSHLVGSDGSDEIQR